MRQWRLDNREKNLETHKKAVRKAKRRINSYQREFRRRHPIKPWLRSINSTQERAGRIGVLTETDLKSLLLGDFHGFPAGECTYCGSIVVPGGNATVDHVDPDGDNVIENVTLACKSCNSSRQRESPQMYIERLNSDKTLRPHIAYVNACALVHFLVSRKILDPHDILRQMI